MTDRYFQGTACRPRARVTAPLRFPSLQRQRRACRGALPTPRNSEGAQCQAEAALCTGAAACRARWWHLEKCSTSECPRGPRAPLRASSTLGTGRAGSVSCGCDQSASLMRGPAPLCGFSEPDLHTDPFREAPSGLRPSACKRRLGPLPNTSAAHACPASNGTAPHTEHTPPRSTPRSQGSVSV